MTDPVKIQLSFQANDYSAEEIKRYRGFFEDQFDIETETHELPAAGGSFGLIIIIKFIGAIIAEGIIYDTLKRASERLLKVFHDRRKHQRPAPETKGIELTFPSMSVILGIDDRGRYSPDEFSVHEKVVEKLGDIVEQVAKHTGSAPLNAASFRFLAVPVLAAQEAAAQPLVKRDWKLSEQRHTRYGIGNYYDSLERRLYDVKP